MLNAENAVSAIFMEQNAPFLLKKYKNNNITKQTQKIPDKLWCFEQGHN